MNLQQVHPNFVCQIWPAIETMLTKALLHSGGEYSIDQLKFMLVRGEHVLLVAEDESGQVHGAATLVLENFPSARIAFVSAVGGRLISTPEIWSQLQNWCRERGATHVRGAARPAVARLWKQRFGFEQLYTIVEQKL